VRLLPSPFGEGYGGEAGKSSSISRDHLDSVEQEP
jgi:hypothetical protein